MIGDHTLVSFGGLNPQETAETASGQSLRFLKGASMMKFILPTGASVETISTIEACNTTVYKVESVLVWIPNLINTSNNERLDIQHRGSYVSRGITISSGGNNSPVDPQAAPPKSPQKLSVRTPEGDEGAITAGEENAPFLILVKINHQPQDFNWFIAKVMHW